MQVIKRNGEIAEFNPDKIYQAILKAAQTVYVLTDDLRQNLAQVTKKVVLDLQEAKVERATISMIQSMVEHRLLGAGYITIAEHYISYRLQRDLERSVMEIISQFIYILNKFAKKKSGMKQLHLTLS
ncbi:ATP cone domain-containing protein [Streptococcus pneumoniae]|nr:ATP cone domain-containing protein [Streptococcus pneumoniae]